MSALIKQTILCLGGGDSIESVQRCVDYVGRILDANRIIIEQTNIVMVFVDLSCPDKIIDIYNDMAEYYRTTQSINITFDMILGDFNYMSTYHKVLEKYNTVDILMFDACVEYFVKWKAIDFYEHISPIISPNGLFVISDAFLRSQTLRVITDFNKINSYNDAIDKFWKYVKTMGYPLTFLGSNIFKITYMMPSLPKNGDNYNERNANDLLLENERRTLCRMEKYNRKLLRNFGFLLYQTKLYLVYNVDGNVGRNECQIWKKNGNTPLEFPAILKRKTLDPTCQFNQLLYDIKDSL